MIEVAQTKYRDFWFWTLFVAHWFQEGAPTFWGKILLLEKMYESKIHLFFFKSLEISEIFALYETFKNDLKSSEIFKTFERRINGLLIMYFFF